jgi:hypothetical protein
MSSLRVAQILGVCELMTFEDIRGLDCGLVDFKPHHLEAGWMKRESQRKTMRQAA